MHHCGDVGLLGHEMARADEPVNIGSRQAGLEITQVDVREHRIRRSPQEQRGDLAQGVHIGDDSGDRLGAGVRRIEGNVLHERADAGASRR